MVWLEVLHALVEEEVGPVLEGAGFRRAGLRWQRGRPGDARSELELAWASWNDPKGSDATIECIGDTRARDYAIPGHRWTVGTDTAQILAFINTGHDMWAEELLGPLGLLDGYRMQLHDASPSLAPLAAAPGPLERIRRLTRFTHRYRWSDSAQLRIAMRHDLQVMLIASEIETHLMPGPMLDRLISAELDRRGMERFFVAPRPPPGLG